MDVFNGRSFFKEDLRVWRALRLGMKDVGGMGSGLGA